MGHIKFLILILFAAGAHSNTLGQNIVFSGDPDKYLEQIQQMFTRTQNEQVISTASDFSAVWGGIGSDHKSKIINQSQLLMDRKMRISPHLTNYIKTLKNAITREGIDNKKFTQYLLMTQKVLEDYNGEQINNYLQTMASFFAHHALYYSSGNKLYTLDDEYSFEYATPGWGDESLSADSQTEDGYTEPEEEYEEEEEEQEELTYEEFLAQSGYSDEPQETESVSDQGSFGNSIPGFVKPEIYMPEAVGPIIRFSSLKLNFATFYDSAFIENTSGFYSVDDHTFTGKEGVFKWESVGIKGVSTRVELDEYTFDTQKPYVKALDASLIYEEVLDKPIEGIFEYKSTRHDSTTAHTYPRFLSYSNDADYTKYQDPDLSLHGGVFLKGISLTTENFARNNSKLEVLGNPGKILIARGYKFILGDSIITTEQAKVSIIHKRDSIFHPAIKMHYETNTKKLYLYRPDNHYADAPFLSSFLNLNFITENVVWDLKADSLDLFIRNGQKWQPMVFESTHHFEASDYQEFSGMYDFHPIGVLAYYSSEYGLDEFALSSVSSDLNLNYQHLEAATIMLDYKGLLYFNRKNGNVRLSEKLKHLRDANFKLVDYDDVIFQSQMEDAAGTPNATMYLEDERMVVRGVEYFQISDSLNVEIEPDSSLLTLFKNRSFEFDGKITAGNFEFNGKDFLFNYDSFLVKLGAIDSVKFYTTDEFGNRRAIDNSMVGLDSASAAVAGIDDAEDQTSGTLYINDPKNKSSLKPLPNYPNFNAGMGGVIYFDKREIFNGVYDKSIFFVVPPFDIDSLSDSDPSSIKFEGVFSSGGMFPNFDEKLEHQPDNSLGFTHEIPEDGYQLFEGSGKLYGDLRLNKGGLQSNGKINFLSTSLLSERFVFYPDSVSGRGFQAEIREEEHNGVIFPQAVLSNYRMKWLPRKDSMYVSNIADPFQFYNNTASLNGTAIISNSGVYGSGVLATKGSEAISKQLTFNHDSYSARHAEFKVSSSDPNKPALAGNDVKLNFNLTDNFADIAPETEGEAALYFPYAQFRTSIPSGRWDLDEQKIYMEKPEDVPLDKSYFYTTNEALDSLYFNAESAIYDINNLELKVSGIPYITVADARITPENNEVLIHENSRIGTLTNTVIILDTINAYHRLYDGVINIVSRNEFSGFATYELISAIGDTFAIKMQDFRLEEFPNPNEGKNTEPVLHTVANGKVLEEENILMSPGMYFKGDVKLLAHKPILDLDGYLKLNLKNIPDYDTWIQYNHSADQEKIAIDFDNSLTEDGKKLSAGLYYNSMDNSLYSIFIEDPVNLDDDAFFTPSGELFYDEENKVFVIENPEKAAGNSFSGSVFKYNENTSDIEFEGPARFFRNTPDVEINAAIMGNGNLKSTEYNINSFLTLDFNINNQIWDLIAQEMLVVIENLGAPEGLGDPTDLLYKLAEIMGEKNTVAYEEQTLQQYVPLAGFSSEVTKPLVFSDVNFKWSEGHHAFYTEGLLGLSNIKGYDLNAAFEGFLEIKKNEDTSPVLNLFIKASADSWYYFGFEDNRLLIYTNNKEINQVVTEKTNSAKAKIGELVFVPGSTTEVLDFVNRFRLEYYGIEEPYKLNAEAVLEEVTNEEKKGEEELEDDGF